MASSARGTRTHACSCPAKNQQVQTKVRARVTLDQAMDALAAYAADMTAGKVLLMPR